MSLTLALPGSMNNHGTYEVGSAFSTYIGQGNDLICQFKQRVGRSFALVVNDDPFTPLSYLFLDLVYSLRERIERFIVIRDDSEINQRVIQNLRRVHLQIIVVLLLSGSIPRPKERFCRCALRIIA